MCGWSKHGYCVLFSDLPLPVVGGLWGGLGDRPAPPPCTGGIVGGLRPPDGSAQIGRYSGRSRGPPDGPPMSCLSWAVLENRPRTARGLPGLFYDDFYHAFWDILVCLYLLLFYAIMHDWIFIQNSNSRKRSIFISRYILPACLYMECLWPIFLVRRTPVLGMTGMSFLNGWMGHLILRSEGCDLPLGFICHPGIIRVDIEPGKLRGLCAILYDHPL